MIAATDEPGVGGACIVATELGILIGGAFSGLGPDVNTEMSVGSLLVVP